MLPLHALILLHHFLILLVTSQSQGNTRYLGLQDTSLLLRDTVTQFPPLDKRTASTNVPLSHYAAQNKILSYTTGPIVLLLHSLIPFHHFHIPLAIVNHKAISMTLDYSHITTVPGHCYTVPDTRPYTPHFSATSSNPS
ncbi:hypothetical protein I3842_13G073900 [Carya illinoinensis]|uniref:Uncharacterized protein n=1 Tax=Carya illinoinensis TaxID=32201 RepID=A0A922DBR8_CARIL|nr:hypothetical protein I3842_13G073900 [Carya illinoinensis]